MTTYDSSPELSPNVDPSVLLLSELEILAAQTRLLDVYLKQAKVSAEQEIARIAEGYKAELAGLCAEAAQKSSALEQFRDSLQDADSRLEDLNRRLREQQSALALRESEHQATLSEVTSLRAQIHELELVNNAQEAAARGVERRRDELEVELADARAALEKTALELKEQRSAARELEERLCAELQQLKTQLAENEVQAGVRESELRKVQGDLATQLQRYSELERERNEVLEMTARESARIQAEFAAQLASWQAAVEQRDRSLEERQSAISQIELSTRAQIGALQAELADKQHRIEAREAELEELRSQQAGLEASIAQSDIAIQQSFLAARDSDQIRQQLESQIAGLRSEVAAKDAALADRSAAVAALESIRPRNEELESQLAQAGALLDAKARDAEKMQSEIALLRNRIPDLENAVATGLATIRDSAAARQALETELAGLQAALAERERLAVEQEQTFKSHEIALNGESDDLRASLSAKANDLDRQAAELGQARAEIAALVKNNSELELLQRQTERLLSAQAEKMRQQVRAELTALENRLTETETMLRAAEEKRRLNDEHFGAKIGDLQLELTEKQLRLESQDAEVQRLRSHIRDLSEQIGEIESAKRILETAGSETAARLRAEHETELSVLRQQLSEAEHSLEQQKTEAVHLEEGRTAEIRELQSQLAEAKREHDMLVEAGRRGFAALQARVAELEISSVAEKDAAAIRIEEIQKNFQGELALVQCEVQQKDWTIAQRQAALENLAQQHKHQVQKFEAKLSEAQQLAETRWGDLEKARNEAASLRDRVVQLETAFEHAQVSAAYQLAQLQRQYEEQLAKSQTELAQCSREFAERTRAMDVTANTASIELQRVSMELQEKRALLESRTDELLVVQAEMDLLQKRMMQLETEARQNEHAAARESERMRADFQAQLASLQADLNQENWILEERPASANGREQDLSAQIPDLQAELAQKEALLQSHAAHSLVKISEPTDAQKQRSQQIDEIVAAAIDAEASFPAPNNRRWRSHLGWKRRWRS